MGAALFTKKRINDKSNPNPKECAGVDFINYFYEQVFKKDRQLTGFYVHQLSNFAVSIQPFCGKKLYHCDRESQEVICVQ